MMSPKDSQTGSGEEKVRSRAYDIWVSEGKPDGKSLDHWLRAKTEVTSNCCCDNSSSNQTATSTNGTQASKDRKTPGNKNKKSSY